MNKIIPKTRKMIVSIEKPAIPDPLELLLELFSESESL
jgi:hypothetical protein